MKETPEHVAGTTTWSEKRRHGICPSLQLFGSMRICIKLYKRGGQTLANGSEPVLDDTGSAVERRTVARQGSLDRAVLESSGCCRPCKEASRGGQVAS